MSERPGRDRKEVVAAGRAPLDEPLRDLLATAHAIEQQALAQLREARGIAGDPGFERILREHLEETEEHEQRVRALLGERGATSATTPDPATRVGGWGFVLFARLPPDTPGKLASHTLSYEALEWASYDLVARAADRAGEPGIADAARSIRTDERAMMERVEGLLERTSEASLRMPGHEDPREALIHCLADAHAVETQSIELLEAGPEMISLPPLETAFREHLEESRAQKTRLEERLDALGGERSRFGDAAIRIGAFNWGMFVQARPDTEAKLAAFAYAFEHLEIGGYEQLRHVAGRAGDGETVDAITRILDEERRAAERISATFDAAVDAALASSSAA